MDLLILSCIDRNNLLPPRHSSDPVLSSLLQTSLSPRLVFDTQECRRRNQKKGHTGEEERECYVSDLLFLACCSILFSSPISRLGRSFAERPPPASLPERRLGGSKHSPSRSPNRRPHHSQRTRSVFVFGSLFRDASIECGFSLRPLDREPNLG